jgi:imidazolonepropionase-like amidohydrolase
MLLSNARLATMQGSRSSEQPYGLIDNGVIAIEAGMIVWVGAASAVPAQYAGVEEHDLAVWDVEHPAELAYRIVFDPLHARIYEGRMSDHKQSGAKP